MAAVNSGLPYQPPPPPAAAAARPASNANPLVAPHLPEVCPQCSARFATVERLIQHVEDFHPSGTSNNPIDLTATNNTNTHTNTNNTSAATQSFQNPLRAIGSAVATAASAVSAAAATASPAPGGGAAGGRGGGDEDVFRCHTCGRQFYNAVHLVHHSERCGAAGQQGATAGGGGGSSGKDNCCIC